MLIEPLSKDFNLDDYTLEEQERYAKEMDKLFSNMGNESENKTIRM